MCRVSPNFSADPFFGTPCQSLPLCHGYRLSKSSCGLVGPGRCIWGFRSPIVEWATYSHSRGSVLGKAGVDAAQVAGERLWRWVEVGHGAGLLLLHWAAWGIPPRALCIPRVHGQQQSCLAGSPDASNCCTCLAPFLWAEQLAGDDTFSRLQAWLLIRVAAQCPHLP